MRRRPELAPIHVRRLVFFDQRFAVVLLAALLLFVGFASRASARKDSASGEDALPRNGERLARPMFLPHCAWTRIVEWRPTVAFADETAPSADALAVIDSTCKSALERYPEFLRLKRIVPRREHARSFPAISLLPANTLIDGKAPRNLNDLPTRFGAVIRRCCYWGLYVDSLDHLFVRNDPLVRDRHTGRLRTNVHFVRTMNHELAHVLNARLGVWDSLGSYDRQRDEDLAEEFVAFMGIDFPTESCADDLAFHRGFI